MIDKPLSNKISNMGVVCAILVVLLHIFPKVKVWSFTWCVDRFISDGLGRAAVPYFFVVSGFLLARHIGEEGWWRKAIRSRIRTLLVPHLVWNLLWMMMPAAIIVSVNLLHGRSTLASVTVPAWRGVFALPPLEPTWYIRTLLLFVLMAPLLVELLKRNFIIVFVISFLLYAMFYRSEAVPFGTWKAFPNTPLALEGLAYFLVGIKLAMDSKPLIIPRNLVIAALVVSVLVTVFRIITRWKVMFFSTTTPDVSSFPDFCMYCGRPFRHVNGPNGSHPPSLPFIYCIRLQSSGSEFLQVRG